MAEPTGKDVTIKHLWWSHSWVIVDPGGEWFGFPQPGSDRWWGPRRHVTHFRSKTSAESRLAQLRELWALLDIDRATF